MMMTRHRLLAALVGASVALTGCVTVVRGTHEPFHIISTPAGATARLSNGESCVTPCTLEIGRADPFQVRIAKSGYVTQTVSVSSTGSGGGGIGLLGNAIVGGVVGVSEDLSNGSMRSLKPNPLRVQLTPAIPAPPEVSPAAVSPAAPSRDSSTPPASGTAPASPTGGTG